MTKFLMTIAAIAVTTLALGTEVQARGHGGGHRGGRHGQRMGRGRGHSHFRHRGYGRGYRHRYGRYGWSGHRGNYWWRYNRYWYYRPSCTSYSYAPCNEVETQVVEQPVCPTTTCQECQTTCNECPTTTCDEVGGCYRPGYRYKGKHWDRRPIKIRPLDQGGRLRSGMKQGGKGGRMGGGRR